MVTVYNIGKNYSKTVLYITNGFDIKEYYLTEKQLIEFLNFLPVDSLNIQ
jgi:hypothetical protein